MTRNETISQLHKLKWRYQKSKSPFYKASIYMLIQDFLRDDDSLIRVIANQILEEIEP